MSTQNTRIGIPPDGFSWTGPNTGIVCCTRCGCHVSRFLTDEHNATLHPVPDMTGLRRVISAWAAALERPGAASTGYHAGERDALTSVLELIDSQDPARTTGSKD